MRVVIDARPLSHPQAGGYRSYVRALVHGLAERNGPEEILLYVDRPLDPTTLPKNFATRVLSPRRIYTDVVLFREQVRRDRPDIVLGTVNYLPLGLHTRTVLTLYDALLLKRYPWEGRVRRTLRQRVLNAYWAALCRHSVARATRLLTVSHGSAHELAAVLRRPLSDFTVVSIGLPTIKKREWPERSTNTVLAIAAPDARKNTAAVLQASLLLTTKNMRLELICTSEATARAVQQHAEQLGLTNVTYLRGVDDARLHEAYARATVFAWPSRLEGFGLPPHEAMQLGCPVVSSDALPMPEVLGEAPLYFAPDDVAMLAAQIDTMVTHPETHARHAALGHGQAARYTVRAMAEGTIALCHEALG